MTVPFIPANTGAGDLRKDRLHALVVRIAAGERPAFRTLYAFLATRVWRDAVRLLPPADARAVARSTFVEIWHLAGHHVDRGDRDTCAWILGITARHLDDRIRTAGGRSHLYDQHTHIELVTLLGTGRATIRTAAATFARVADLHSVPAAAGTDAGPAIPRPFDETTADQPAVM